ncbi:hypothetical protein [Streptomyces tubercidicus]|uniref:Uncharacterized protein n=1 Tax=Streptomyces tubercidicus TaxID=47759 RepID=A0A640UIL3_9ACTN|nr:hypothetical protein [Streptomyces tubercidicus]WAU10522.1 hypothetical protein STRTU_000611 [Streptomyces tubercidicus]GFE35627.1 hypothetical protein Stube_03000 [Streptomyces tubercidicus]
MHTLRLTYAGVLIARTAGPKVVATRLAETIELAVASYTHRLPDEVEGTRGAVEAFFESAPDMCPTSADDLQVQVITPRLPDSGDPPRRPNRAA